MGGFDVSFRLFQKRMIVEGDIYDYAQASASLARGDADLISFARLFLANPDLPERFAQHAPLNTSDARTFYGGDDKGYTDYPFLESLTPCCHA